MPHHRRPRRRASSRTPRVISLAVGCVLLLSGCSSMMKTAVEGIPTDGNAVNAQQALEVKIAKDLYQHFADAGAEVGDMTGKWVDCSTNLTHDRAQWVMSPTVTVQPGEAAAQLDVLYAAASDAGWDKGRKDPGKAAGTMTASMERGEQRLGFVTTGGTDVRNEFSGVCQHSKVFGTPDYPVSPQPGF